MGCNSLHFHTHKREKNGGHKCSQYPKMSTYLFISQYSSHDAHKYVREILFSNVKHQMEEYK